VERGLPERTVRSATDHHGRGVRRVVLSGERRNARGVRP
jgi:hypothetical protein